MESLFNQSFFSTENSGRTFIPPFISGVTSGNFTTTSGSSQECKTPVRNNSSNVRFSPKMSDMCGENKLYGLIYRIVFRHCSSKD